MTPQSPTPVALMTATLSGASRKVLDVISAAGRPLTVTDVARALNRHPSSVRPHLDQLTEIGLVEHRRRYDGARGRPAVEYVARLGNPARIYACAMDLFMNAVLLLTPEQAYQVALGCGQRQRVNLAHDTEASRSLTVSWLSELGFAPQWIDDRHLRLTCTLFGNQPPPKEAVYAAVRAGLIHGLAGGTDEDIEILEEPEGPHVIAFR